MRTVDMIQKKRNGGELSRLELADLIGGYTRGDIPDYQMAAWAMAVYFRGMSERETADLTLEMAGSGEQADLAAIRGIKVDKHSTGGVGDTVTLVLAPLVAAAGVPVAKMSGRGLGHTGGTIDKLEAIPGFRTEMDRQTFLEQVNRIGVAVIGQSGHLAPADKKLYSLRDVTATVDSIPLIASSIMSKKLASGADAIVLDVKTGDGAFMKTVEDAIALAKAMVGIGTAVGRDTVAVISSMEEPLGTAIGNALEVKLAIETLSGRGPADLIRLCLELGAYMLKLGGKAENVSEGKERLLKLLDSGEALRKFSELVAAQGGDPRIADDPGLLPQAGRRIPVLAANGGYVQRIHAEQIGKAAMKLGAGRETKESKIDLAVGITLLRKTGDWISAGEPVAELHVNGERQPIDALAEVQAAYTIGLEPKEPAPLLQAIVRKDGVDRMV